MTKKNFMAKCGLRVTFLTVNKGTIFTINILITRYCKFLFGHSSDECRSPDAYDTQTAPKN